MAQNNNKSKKFNKAGYDRKTQTFNSVKQMEETSNRNLILTIGTIISLAFILGIALPKQNAAPATVASGFANASASIEAIKTDINDAHIGDFRERPPQVGDNWGGCNDARAAGTAPIYSHEPGYRANMDGDGDGIACEPHRHY